MKILTANPAGWPCTLEECPPGHMTGTGQHADCVWFKSEYRTTSGKVEAFNEAGEFLCIGEGELVQPISFTREDDGA